DIQIAFTSFLQRGGSLPDTYGGGLSALSSLAGCLNLGTLHGGTHTLAHASYRIVAENGGKAFTRHPVEKIIVENGTARGVRLADGSVVEAKKAVLSGVDPYQLCVELVGEEHLGAGIIRKIKNLETTIAVTWYTWALKERPRYTAEEFSPGLTQSGCIWFGHPGEVGMKNLMDEVYRLRMGLWPDKDKMHIRLTDHSG
ncbi:MAG: dependent oxidoreductase, partial [Dehalococcoidia bacterium]|nr:dependent oxidoreductase [Dehalococcoidia bacterium]